MQKVSCKYLIAVIISCSLSSACISFKNNNNNTNKGPVYKYNFASLYNPNNTILHPNYKIYITNNNSAKVYFKVKINEIKKVNIKASGDKLLLYIKYITRNVNDFTIIDSASYLCSINTKQFVDNYENSFTIPLPKQTNYKITISLYGDKENTIKRTILDIDNSTKYSDNMFLCETINESSNINYTNIVNSNSVYKIYSQNLDIKNLLVQYYKPDSYIVIPPYISISANENKNIKPDSVYLVNINDSLKFIKKGYYVFKDLDSVNAYFYFINYGLDYPNITTINDMLEPLKLLTTNKEYNEIANSKNIKIAIDKFWLLKSKNQQYAQEQIRVFYNRVALANEYFSDYREGWKTDRGNIYVMMGAPNYVFLNSHEEEWYYGENPEVASVNFVFRKFEKPPFKMAEINRDNTYQTLWAQILNTWKNGKIFSLSK